MNVTIRQAEVSDIVKIKDFFAMYWRSNHPFINQQELLDFQHYDTEGQNYLFAIAENSKTSEILGICGWLSYRKWDRSLYLNNSIWYTNWFLKPETKGLLGIRIQEAIQEFDSVNCVGTVGLRKYTLPLYNARRYQTGRLATVTCRAASKQISNKNHCTQMSVSEVSGLHIKHEYLPVKTPEFFINKYIRNPFRKYQIFDVTSGEEGRSIAVFRPKEKNNYRQLLLVDYCGSQASFKRLASTVVENSIFDDETTCELSANETAIPSEWFDYKENGCSDGNQTISTEHTIWYAFRQMNQTKDETLICYGDGDHDRI